MFSKLIPLCFSWSVMHKNAGSNTSQAVRHEIEMEWIQDDHGCVGVVIAESVYVIQVSTEHTEILALGSFLYTTNIAIIWDKIIKGNIPIISHTQKIKNLIKRLIPNKTLTVFGNLLINLIPTYPRRMYAYCKALKRMTELHMIKTKLKH